MMLFSRENRKKPTHRTPLIWRPQAPNQGNTVDFFLFPRLKSIMKGADSRSLMNVANSVL
jgi:hypothetical protein